MSVKIKDFKVDMEIKNAGMELEIRGTGDEFLGDVVVTKTGLTWCKGKTKKANGIKVTWKEFTAFVEQKAADKAAKTKKVPAAKKAPAKNAVAANDAAPAVKRLPRAPRKAA